MKKKKKKKKIAFLDSEEKTSCDELIKIIQPLAPNEKESVRQNLRTGYEAVSDYTIHYSNVRVILSTFFISVAFFVLFNQLRTEEPAKLLFAAGLGAMAFGFYLNLVLTRLMQSGLRVLVQIEYILDSIASIGPIAEPQLINYFFSWNKNLNSAEATKDVWREKLTILWIVLVIGYLAILCAGYRHILLFTDKVIKFL